LYLRDGTNFNILKAYDIGNDSISFLLENKTCIRMPVVDVYKIVLCQSYAKIPDSLNTVALVTGIKYAASMAFNFHKGTVNLKLANGEFKNVPIEMIESFTPIDTKLYTKDNGKLNFSYGFHALYASPFGKRVPGIELSALYKLNDLLEANLYAGVFIRRLNSSNFTLLEHLDNFQVPKTTSQLNSNKPLNFNNYESIHRNGYLFKNMTYVGAKIYFYLTGYEIKNYLGLGSNYYFGSNQSSLNAKTKWIEFDRRISVYDSVLNRIDYIEEPVFARSSQNYTYTREAFALFNASYKIKYWISKNCYVTNEIGMLLGRVKVNVLYEQNNEYQYVKTNYYEDETNSNLSYSYDTKIPLNQLYISIGMYFNK
jgi:hypothetical protein